MQADATGHGIRGRRCHPVRRDFSSFTASQTPVASEAKSSVGATIQAGWNGTDQWTMAHQTTAHLARISSQTAPRNQNIRTGYRFTFQWK